MIYGLTFVEGFIADEFNLSRKVFENPFGDLT
jgi:hypothetical protein